MRSFRRNGSESRLRRMCGNFWHQHARLVSATELLSGGVAESGGMHAAATQVARSHALLYAHSSLPPSLRPHIHERHLPCPHFWRSIVCDGRLRRHSAASSVARMHARYGFSVVVILVGRRRRRQGRRPPDCRAPLVGRKREEDSRRLTEGRPRVCLVQDCTRRLCARQYFERRGARRPPARRRARTL